jgi:ASC-1-like (ASCH) protein
MTPQDKAFLKEYIELCKKHQRSIETKFEACHDCETEIENVDLYIFNNEDFVFSFHNIEGYSDLKEYLKDEAETNS